MTKHDMTVTRRLFLQTTAAAGGGLMLGGFVPGLVPAAEAAGVFEPNRLKLANRGDLRWGMLRVPSGTGYDVYEQPDGTWRHGR